DLQAIADYRLALVRQPPPEQRRMILRELADSLVGQRDYAAARTALAEAEEDAFVLALRAECSRNLGDHEQAQGELARALQLDPHERQALFLQARIFREERSPEKAVPLLRGIVEQDPHDYPARYQLAQVLGQLGQAALAAEELSQAKQ